MTVVHHYLCSACSKFHWTKKDSQKTKQSASLFISDTLAEPSALSRLVNQAQVPLEARHMEEFLLAEVARLPVDSFNMGLQVR